MHAPRSRGTIGRTIDFRDLIDLLLLGELLERADLVGVRQACEEIFGLRAQHPWPPELRVQDDWPEPYRALAAEIGFPVDDVEEAAAAVRAFVARIAEAS